MASTSQIFGNHDNFGDTFFSLNDVAADYARLGNALKKCVKRRRSQPILN